MARGPALGLAALLAACASGPAPVDGRPAASLAEIAGEYEVLEFRGAPGDARGGRVSIGEAWVDVKAACNGVGGAVAMMKPGLIRPSTDEFEVTAMGCVDARTGRPSGAERRDDILLDLIAAPFNVTWRADGTLALWRGDIALVLRPDAGRSGAG